MFGKKVRRIYVLHSVKDDMKDLAVAVFTTKRKAKKYYDEVIKCFKEHRNNVCYDINRQRHYVEAGENTFTWYIEEGNTLDRKFNPNGYTTKCVYL